MGYSHFCEFHLLELDLIITVNTKKKSSHTSSCGRGEVTILEYMRAVFPNKVCPQEELVTQSLNIWVSSEPNQPEGRDILSHLSREKETETHL